MASIKPTKKEREGAKAPLLRENQRPKNGGFFGASRHPHSPATHTRGEREIKRKR